MIYRKIHVYGRVQGVYFRASTKSKADELGVRGFVKNCPDGSVYIEAIASEDKMTRFYEWCKKGPEQAKVEEIKIQNLTSENNYQSFVVKH